MLTRDEVATMRRNVVGSQYREVRSWSVVCFEGGPLDGLCIRVLPNEASSYRVGFCIVARTGPVQALYRPDEALAVIHDTPHVGEYVFLSRFNKPYTVQGLRSIVTKHLGMTTYDLRHTFAQACIDAGEHPEIVTKMLGHNTSRMVWTYARIRDEQMIEAASRIKLRRASDAS